MKKLLTVLTFAAAASTSLFGQGTVTFQNSGSIFTAVADRRVYLGANLTDTTALLKGTNYFCQLWYQPIGALDLVPVPNTVSNVSLGAIRHFRSTTTTLPGTWDTAPNATVVLDGILIGMTTKLQVRVWDSAEYSSWQDAMNRNGKHGESAIFDYTVPQPGSPGSAFSLENLRAFGVVPEPSVIALAAIGLGALLLRRRK